MLTGRQAFEGKSRASLISAIMSGQPRPISEFAPVAPSSLERVVKKCLAKDRDGRWQTALDLRDEIVWIYEGGGQKEGTIVETRHAPWVAAFAIAAIAVGIGVWLFTSSPVPAPKLKHLAIPLPPEVTLPSGRGTLITIAPDGTKLAFMGERDGVEQIFVRSMDTPEVHAVPGTENAQHPAFSPDGDEIAFDVQGRPYKMSLPSGPRVSLAELGRYPTWGPDGYIYYWSGRLWRVPSNGGEALALTPSVPTDSSPNGRPDVLPNGKAVLFEGADEDGTRTVELLVLESGEVRSLVADGSNPRYVPSGHILFALSETVLAIPFDADDLRVTGQPVPVGHSIRTEVNGAAQFAVAHDGSLVYARSSVAERGSLVRVDRQGRARPIGDSRVGLLTPRVSPDGKRVAVEILHDIWIYELDRAVMTRLTLNSATSPIWSPDGMRLAFSRRVAGSRTVFVRSVQRSEEAQPLTGGDRATALSWSTDGRSMILSSLRSDTQRDIDLLLLDHGKRSTLLGTRFEEIQGVLSPDGRWLAYGSNESGRREVFVVSFPDASHRRQISTEGGTEPMWARDGRELFYRSGDKMMSVPIDTEAELTPGKPEILFEAPFAVSTSLSSNYDVAPNDEGFIMIQRQTETRAELDVVLNWLDELKRLAPAEN